MRYLLRELTGFFVVNHLGGVDSKFLKANFSPQGRGGWKRQHFDVLTRKAPRVEGLNLPSDNVLFKVYSDESSKLVYSRKKLYMESCEKVDAKKENSFNEKFSPFPGFEPRTSLVPSLYATNWAILAWMASLIILKCQLAH